MVKRELIWSKHADIQLYELLVFFKNRNKSNVYSAKLYKRFNAELEKTLTIPDIGIKTRLKNIRGLIAGNYILYYEIFEDRIIVLKIWDCRKDPDKLRFK
jgi:hypothetical protein